MASATAAGAKTRTRRKFADGSQSEWAVVRDSEVLGVFDDFDKAKQTAVDRIGCGPFFIRALAMANSAAAQPSRFEIRAA